LAFGIHIRMSIQTSMVGYYAERASEYERIYQKPERQADLQVLRGFVENTFAGANVFEVACGTGYWTEIVARSAGSVIATDINEEVLAIAHSKRMSPEVTYQKEDAYALPPSSRRITAGLSVFWWSHIPKSRVREFLLGFHRVLSPGARVVFIDSAYVEGSSTPISRRDEHGDTFQIRRLDDGSAHEVLKNFPTESELRAAVDDLASGIRVEFLQYYWTLSYVLPEIAEPYDPPNCRPALWLR
jgi:demethylmenaquinone methyltransferase/2-methoxy-6-polyprenyl-1,4-benzoquinol methylase